MGDRGRGVRLREVAPRLGGRFGRSLNPPGIRRLPLKLLGKSVWIMTWIALDLLGISRPNRDFSRGCGRVGRRICLMAPLAVNARSPPVWRSKEGKPADAIAGRSEDMRGSIAAILIFRKQKPLFCFTPAAGLRSHAWDFAVTAGLLPIGETRRLGCMVDGEAWALNYGDMPVFTICAFELAGSLQPTAI